MNSAIAGGLPAKIEKRKYLAGSVTILSDSMRIGGRIVVKEAAAVLDLASYWQENVFSFSPGV